MRVLLVIYDNGSFIHYFPIGMGYVAAVLRDNEHEVTIYNQDQHHYPEEHLTKYLDKNKFDVIGVSTIGGYYQYRKLLSISKAVNKSKNRPLFIIGGHGPTPDPEYFLKKTQADIVVMGEGENTIIDLLAKWSNKESLDKVSGIAYREGDKVKINEPRPLIEDIDSIPFPAYDLFPMEYYRLFQSANSNMTDFNITMLSGRGCKFKCNFCYRMDEGLRLRSNESIVDEIKLLKNKYSINRVAFWDELLISSKERAVSLSEDFLKQDLNIKWSCNGRLNYADPEVLKIMKKAGCDFINYGIEAVDDQVLKNMQKALTVDIITKGIEATLKEGISPGLNIIFGNIGDNLDTLNKGVEFLLKYDDGAQLRTIRPVTPYPGSPLYYLAIEKGLLKDCADFYENKHVNSDLLTVNFTELTDEEFHNALFKANQRLLDNYFKSKYNFFVTQSKELYCDKNVGFRGFRHK